jgi:hypothetical protein
MGLTRRPTPNSSGSSTRKSILSSNPRANPEHPILATVAPSGLRPLRTIHLCSFKRQRKIRSNVFKNKKTRKFSTDPAKASPEFSLPRIASSRSTRATCQTRACWSHSDSNPCNLRIKNFISTLRKKSTNSKEGKVSELPTRESACKPKGNSRKEHPSLQSLQASQ